MSVRDLFEPQEESDMSAMGYRMRLQKNLEKHQAAIKNIEAVIKFMDDNPTIYTFIDLTNKLNY